MITGVKDLANESRQQLNQAKTPTTLIAAEDDHFTPPGAARGLATLRSTAYLEPLPRGGHFFPATVPAIHNELVLRALPSERQGGG